MRVVHAAGWYFPQHVGGTEVYVAAVSRELQRSGVDVHIAAPDPGAAKPHMYEHGGIPVFRYPIPPVPTRAEARGDAVARGAEAFHEFLSAMRPDVVHFHTFVTGLDWIEIDRARAAGARVFVTSHSSALGYICLRGTLLRWGTDACDGIARPQLCAACALQHRGVPSSLAKVVAAMPLAAARAVDQVDHPLATGLGLQAYVERRLQRQHRLFEDIHGFFALTNAARNILVANGAPEAKVCVNRLGIDTDVVAPAQHDSRRSTRPITIGYLGRFDPIKGIDDLVTAVGSISPDIPLRLELRGTGDDAEARRIRESCIAAARRDARITVGGPVARSEVTSVLRSWDLLCCPGLSLEGGPTVALEAFAVGTPVIGSRFGGLAEIVSDGENGRLVPPGDWRALAGAIAAVAAEPETIDRWRSNIPPVRSMRDVASQYLTSYTRELH